MNDERHNLVLLRLAVVAGVSWILVFLMAYGLWQLFELIR